MFNQISAFLDELFFSSLNEENRILSQAIEEMNQLNDEADQEYLELLSISLQSELIKIELQETIERVDAINVSTKETLQKLWVSNKKAVKLMNK
jgi:hypothetical protein